MQILFIMCQNLFFFTLMYHKITSLSDTGFLLLYNFDFGSYVVTSYLLNPCSTKTSDKYLTSYLKISSFLNENIESP
jgi:hypothetical protein